MQNLNYPKYLLPLEVFSSAEVIGVIREKKDSSGEPKKETFTGENLPGWVIPVEIVRGLRKKTLPNGNVLETADSETVNVTLWSKEKPHLEMGDYVSFFDLMVGAYEGRIYVQALKVEKVSSRFDLDFGEE